MKRLILLRSDTLHTIVATIDVIAVVEIRSGMFPSGGKHNRGSRSSQDKSRGGGGRAPSQLRPSQRGPRHDGRP
jgi:hypothetical protein